MNDTEQTLFLAVTSKDAAEVDVAVEALRQFDPSELGKSAAILLKNPSIAIRRRTATILHRLKNSTDSAFAALVISLSGDPVWTVREAVAEALATIAVTNKHFHIAQETLLRGAMFDSNGFVRESCSQSLNHLSGNQEHALMVLEETWRNSKMYLRCRALQAACRLSSFQHIGTWLHQALNDSHWKLRTTALKCLLRLPGPFHDLFGLVLKRCFDKQPAVARAAKDTLRNHREQIPVRIANSIPSTVWEKGFAAGPDAVLCQLIDNTVLSPNEQTSVINTYSERFRWHLKKKGETPNSEFRPKSIRQAVQACVDAATDQGNPERSQHREYAWHLATFCDIVGTEKSPLGSAPC